MEWVETTAKTIEEAKSLALDQLGVADEDAEFEIVDEPRPGLFGRMRGEARVRARVRPTQPRPKADRRDRRKPKAKADGADAPRSRPSRSRTPANEATESTESTDAEIPASPAPRSRSRRDSSRPTGETAPMTDATSPAPDAATVGNAAVDFLTGLVNAFDLPGTVSLHDVDGDMEVRVDGDNLGLLVGPRGATLLAIQDITRVASQRRLGDHETRLRVDVASYRVKRREALGRFADKVAAEVAASGEERILEPMPSPDRKVIHDTLTGRADVVTRSEGEEPRRYVVVAPA
jgi:spoIIIJ-associated protein